MAGAFTFIKRRRGDEAKKDETKKLARMSNPKLESEKVSKLSEVDLKWLALLLSLRRQKPQEKAPQTRPGPPQRQVKAD
jgi:hypothetical protein